MLLLFFFKYDKSYLLKKIVIANFVNFTFKFQFLLINSTNSTIFKESIVPFVNKSTLSFLFFNFSFFNMTLFEENSFLFLVYLIFYFLKRHFLIQNSFGIWFFNFI